MITSFPMEEIANIQRIRKSLNLTQKELAGYAGVSQSLIAKIESDRIDPAYSKAVKIFNALTSLSKKKELKAKDVMTSRVISLSPSDTIKKAIRMMKNYNISQLPVIDNKKPIGRVTEANILDALTREVSPDSSVIDIMDDEAPIVSKDAGVSLVSSLLKQYNFVLVSEKGRVLGVITKADLLTKAYG